MQEVVVAIIIAAVAAVIIRYVYRQIRGKGGGCHCGKGGCEGCGNKQSCSEK